MNVNGFLFRNDVIKVDTEVQYTAIALGQGVIDEARWKSFDSIDTYNGYSKTDTTQDGVYHIDASIAYVNLANTDSASATPTDHKKLTVVVTNKSMSKPIRLSYIKNK
jgi:hypothetical protein